MKKIFLFIISGLLFTSFSVRAQTKSAADSSVNGTNFFKKNVTVNALIVGNYAVSLTDSVGINGIHSLKDSAINNGFNLRYVRVSGRFQITPRFDANVLVNLSEFKNDPQGKVLENAFMRYKLNDYVNLQFGQFRPFFGIEDLYGVEQHKSYYWSNQYNAFNRSNWMSFQLGAAFYGSLKPINIPLKYYFTVYNGNGRNVELDNDNSKDFSMRLESEILKGFTVGANFATTNFKRKNVGAYTFDLQTFHKLNNNWDLETESSYAYGYNLRDFMDAKVDVDKIKNYRMHGLYVLPLLRYNIHKPGWKGVELSCRYENLLENIDINPNPRTTIVPMVSFLFADNHAAKFSLVGIIDRYKHKMPGTNKYSQNQLLAQFQLRF